MRIAVFGAAGQAGSAVVAEALSRGHEVTAIVRNESRFAELDQRATARVGTAADADAVAEAVTGHDVVVSAISTGTESEFTTVTRALLDGVAKAGGPRLLSVGGAGSLQAAPGQLVIDDPHFPAAWKPIAQAQADALEVYRADTTVDWAYLSPAALLQPGERTGKYRLGTDHLVTDAEGNSAISYADLAVVLLDEIEQPRHRRVRFTAAY